MRDQLHNTLSDRDWSQRLTPAQRAALPPSVADRIARYGNGPHISNPAHINNMRRDFYHNHYPTYWTRDWYAHHPRAWHCPVPPSAWWYRPTWSSSLGWFTAGFFTAAVIDRVCEPIPYYYGTNVYYSNGMVNINGVPYVSAEEYYAQARRLVAQGQEQMAVAAQPTQININLTTPSVATPFDIANTDEWMPLGTFAVLTTPDDTSVTRVLQLATNKTGLIRGNIVDTENNRVYPVVGSVDSQTQRVAISPIDDNQLIIECGLWNLTQDTLTALVHRDSNRVEERTLVRLAEPEESKVEPPIL